MSYSTPLKTFADVQALLDAFYTANQATIPIGNAPHGEFWQTNKVTGLPMTWQEFTTGVLPLTSPYDVQFQNPAGDVNSPKILVVGNAKASVIINMLSAAGPYWDAVGNNAGQMPQDNPPYLTSDPSQPQVIQLLSDWINSGCPNGPHSLVLREE